MNNTTTTSVAIDFASMREDLQRRMRRLEELFTTASVVSATPSTSPSASLSSPASSTTPPPTTTDTPTSIDATMRCFPTTVEPPRAPHARYSTPSCSLDECAIAPPSTAPALVLASSSVSSASPVASYAPAAPTASSTPTSATPSAEEALPTRCSTNGLSSDIKVLKPNFSADSSWDANKSYSFERYITNPIPVYYIGVVLPCLANKVCAVQKGFEVRSAHNSLLLQPLHATLVDKGPWPPPMPFEFRDGSFRLECAAASCVFDRGKSRMGVQSPQMLESDVASQIIWMLRCQSPWSAGYSSSSDACVQLRPKQWPSFPCPTTQLCFSSGSQFSGDAPSTLTCHYLVLDCQIQLTVVQHSLLSWSLSQTVYWVFTDYGQSQGPAAILCNLLQQFLMFFSANSGGENCRHCHELFDMEGLINGIIRTEFVGFLRLQYAAILVGLQTLRKSLHCSVWVKAVLQRFIHLWQHRRANLELLLFGETKTVHMAILTISEHSEIPFYLIVPIEPQSFNSITMHVSVVSVLEWPTWALPTDNVKIQRKKKFLVLAAITNNILQYAMVPEKYSFAITIQEQTISIDYGIIQSQSTIIAAHKKKWLGL